MMRVATWNLERGSRRKAAGQQQLEVLDALAPDVSVLTEPSPAILGLADEVVVSGGPDDAGRLPWVAIRGSNLHRRAAGALWFAAEMELHGPGGSGLRVGPAVVERAQPRSRAGR